MWGRRVEILLLACGIGFLSWGFVLPPPVGRTKTLSGAVEHLKIGAGKGAIEFVVAGERLTTSHREPGYRNLRESLREGVEANVRTWPRGGWPGDASVVLEVSIDGRAVVDGGSRLAVYWLKSIVFIVMGAAATGATLCAFRQPRSLAERALRASTTGAMQ